MKKIEMVEILTEAGYDVSEEQTYNEIYKVFKEYQESEKLPIIATDEETVDEHVERKIARQLTKEEQLAAMRAELFPKIVDLMNRLKGRRTATQDELRELFNLYNAFYLRSDSPTCGSCVSRVYRTFEKMCKGRM